MQINENPTANYDNARKMRWGHDFPKDKGEGMLTLSQFGEKPSFMERTHQNCQLPSFLSSPPNHLICQKVVEVVIAWKGKSMGNFKLGRAPSFGMSCFACMDKKTPEPYASLTHAFTFWFYSYVLGATRGWGAHSQSSFPIRGTLGYQQSSSYVYPLHSASVFPLGRL